MNESNTSFFTDFDCYAEGKRRALTKIYEEEWLWRYRNLCPTDKMKKFIEEKDAITMKNYYFITMATDPKRSFDILEFVEFCYCMKKRTFCGKLICMGFEEANEGIFECHMIMKCGRYWSPGTVAGMIFRGKGKKYCAQNCIDVKRVSKFLVFTKLIDSHREDIGIKVGDKRKVRGLYKYCIKDESKYNLDFVALKQARVKRQKFK